MRRPRLPGPAFSSLTSPGRAALRVGLFVVLGALSVALVLLSDGRTPAAAGPVESAWLTACGNGMAVAEPETNPALVADCAALLEARDALRGTAELNWSADLGLSEWSGITIHTVGGVQRVTVLNLERQGLNGMIPSALSRLTGLRELRLGWRNPLTGVIPPRLGWLGELGLLQLARNELSGVIPTQLGHLLNLDNLLRRYVQGNSGISGCVPPRLREVQTNDLARLNLPDCADGAAVSATFTPLPADRCPEPTAANCLRAVYVGAPDDYAQVQDIPDSVLIQPDDDGRYTVERGQQITVVTAAPLPTGYTRFYLQRRPQEGVAPTSYERLIPPVGTTYTFTVTTDERGASPISFDLTAARPRPLPRPGQKPELGNVVVTTEFLLPLTLELTSSRALCTANTLTELSWTIAGGRPPYTLTIDGETVDANAESHRANCGPIPTDPFTGDPIPASSKRWTATVSDSQEPSASISQRIEIELVEPLAPPPLIWMSAFGTQIAIAWTETEEHRAAVWYGKGGVYAIRFRLEDTIAWTYPRHHTGPVAWIELPVGDMTVQMAVLRAPIEQATPQALRWSENHRIARVEEPANATAVATHDTVTVSWDRQPLTGNHGDVTITAMDARASALSRNFYEDPDDRSTRFSFTFEHLPPDSDYEVTITYGSLGIAAISRTLEVRTREAPESWQPLPSGPQNLRATAGHRWITVQWDPPFVGAEPSYLVQIIDESDGTKIDSKSTDQTEWTSYGSFRPIWPSMDYRIYVLHRGIPEVEAEILITTPPQPGGEGNDRSRARGQAPTDPWEDIWAFRFHPIWPVALDDHYAMTDDPFQWRVDETEERFHAGLDIGAKNDGAARTQLVGEPRASGSTQPSAPTENGTGHEPKQAPPRSGSQPVRGARRPRRAAQVRGSRASANLGVGEPDRGWRTRAWRTKPAEATAAWAQGRRDGHLALCADERLPVGGAGGGCDQGRGARGRSDAWIGPSRARSCRLGLRAGQSQQAQRRARRAQPWGRRGDAAPVGGRRHLHRQPPPRRARTARD